MRISNLKIILPDRIIPIGSIQIENGLIAEIIEGTSSHSDIDAQGLVAIPGIIDMHGDMLEREIEPRPNARLPYDLALHELDKRLISAGVTTAYAAVSFSEISILKASLRRSDTASEICNAIYANRQHLLVDLRVHARFEVTNDNSPPILTELIEDGLVDMISLNDHTPGQGQYRDIEKYLVSMSQWRNISSDYATHVTRDLVKEAQARPIAWETIRAVTNIAQLHQLPIASHDDDTPSKVNLMHDMGCGISEFPVTLEAAQAAQDKGLAIAMGAPNALRGVSTSGNLSAQDAIAAGLVDMLASDYHPGALLQAAFLIADRGLLSLPQAIALITANPARALGLADRGTLAVGMQADLVLLANHTRPRVCATFREGKQIYSSAFNQLRSVDSLDGCYVV